MARARSTLINALRRNVPSGAKLLVAVSGGRDSVALLHALCALSRVKRLSLDVAHVDHGVRKSSAEDASFVRSLATKRGLPLHLKRCGAKPRALNLEAWGREQRYSFFEEVRKKEGLDFILTAHTADDVAETLLMRLVSNKELRTIDHINEKRHLLRPILEISRAEINSYVNESRLTFREDESNSNTDFLRNRVRAKLLPFLKSEFDARVTESLAERSRALDDDGRFLYGLAVKAVSRLKNERFGSKSWLAAFKTVLRPLEPALKWRAVQVALLPKLGFNLGRGKCFEMITLIEGGSVGIELPGGVRFRRSKGELHQIY